MWSLPQLKLDFETSHTWLFSVVALDCLQTKENSREMVLDERTQTKIFRQDGSGCNCCILLPKEYKDPTGAQEQIQMESLYTLVTLGLVRLQLFHLLFYLSENPLLVLLCYPMSHGSLQPFPVFHVNIGLRIGVRGPWRAPSFMDQLDRCLNVELTFFWSFQFYPISIGSMYVINYIYQHLVEFYGKCR